MERAPPFVTNRLASVLGEAAKVGVAVWVVLTADPWVAQNLPALNAGWRYALSTIITVLLVEILLQLILGWPRISILWEAKGEAAPISSIVARATRRNPNSQVFVVKVSIPPSGWVSYQALRLLMLFDVTLQIRIDRAGVIPTVENASLNGTAATVTPDLGSHGVTVALGRVPRRPGKWHWGDVRWEVGNASVGVDMNVDCVLHHPWLPVRIILGMLVRRTTNVRHFNVERV